MRRSVLVALVVLTTLTAALSGAGVVSAAGVDDAQEFAQTDENASTTSTAESSDEGPTEVVSQVDDRLSVASKSYDAENQTFFVVLRNDDDRRSGEPSEVTLTELVDRSSHGGSARFGIERVTVEPGESVRVGVFARRVDGRAGVMVTTRESVENGEGRLVQEPPQSFGLLRGSSTWGDVRAAGAGALVGSIVVVVLAAWQVVAARHESYEAVDLDGGDS